MANLSVISVTELAARMASHQTEGGVIPLQLVDVREPDELAIAGLDQFMSLPLSQFPSWSNQIHTLLDRNTETLVLCHHGIRSGQMCYWLIDQGFTNVKNITGGIDAYAQLVDRAIALY